MIHAKSDVPPFVDARAGGASEPSEVALVPEMTRDMALRRAAYIDAAWRRCTELYQLDPAGQPAPEHIGGAALKHRREALALFELVGRGEMQRLFDQLNQQIVQPSSASPRFVLMLVDAEATILDVLATPGTLEQAHEAHMRPGFLWDERHVGANGPGTCVHDGRTRLVHRDDHFFRCNRTMSCSAAPVWNAEGELLGALDISSFDCQDSRASQIATSALVAMSARIVEQLHFAQQYRDALIMHFHEQPEFFGLPYESLLAIDNTGRVLAVDGTVTNRLGFSTRSALVGRSISDLFDITPERLFAYAETQPMAAWPVAYGQNGHGFASLRPAAAPRLRSARSLRNREVARPAAPARHNATLRALAGEDPVMLKNVWRAEHVMNKDIHVLLLGETGTGKDTFARAIHAASDRHEGPFIVMSCAAIPEALIESELFGYEAGAFTGARAGGMRGKALAAHRGTLFLDEIGDMPLSIQARLLRLLEEKEVVPLGSATPVPVDIRVISATHEDLEALVARGEFRMDLFYRLNGVSLMLPALRFRADRAALIERVAQEENGGVPITITPEARAIFSGYAWPGNIRELRNALRTAIAFAEGGTLEVSHLPGALARGSWGAAGRVREPAGRSAEDLAEPANPTEHALILSELERQHWRITSTANALGMSRNTLYRKLRRYGLLPPVTPES
jgi:sigma-54 dependent transcriptional regulator, acetoin dehydrogenase operon transcriptional activator AcoR